MELPKILIAGTGEKVQYLAHDFNDNTVRFALRYPGKINPDTLCSAVSAVISSVDVLHASFIPGNVGAYWRINEGCDKEDFFTLTENAQQPLTAAREAMLLPVLPEEKAQLHCTLVRGPKEDIVVLRISHLCVDGGDGKYLLYKLAEAYELIARTGNAEGLSVKNGSRATMQMYKELTPKEYLSLIRSPLSGVKTEFPFPGDAPGKRSLVSCCIPAFTMNAAHKAAKALNATVNDLLLSACYRAYGKLPGADPKKALSIMSMMDLRRHCKNGESEGLCNMSGFFPTTLTEGIRGDFAETLKEVSAQTRKAKENPLAGMEGMPIVHTAVQTTPLRLLLEVMEKVYGSMSIGLTNLGNMPCDALTLDGIRPTGGLFAGPLKKKPAMQVSAASFDGAAVLCSISECAPEDAALLQQMLDYAAQEIEDFARAGQ